MCLCSSLTLVDEQSNQRRVPFLLLAKCKHGLTLRKLEQNYFWIGPRAAEAEQLMRNGTLLHCT